MPLVAQRLWSGGYGARGGAVTALLIPVSWLWSVVARLHGSWRERRSTHAPSGQASPWPTVLSIGNVAVGGTGKTPFVSWVARGLTDGGHRCAIITNGHAPDEARLHRRWHPFVAVYEAGDRADGVRLAGESGAEIVLLDDGFQYRQLARAWDVVLLSAEDGFPARVLPAGPFRESPRALERADVVVVTRRVASREVARDLAGSVARWMNARGTSVPVIGGVHLRPDRIQPFAAWSSGELTAQTQPKLGDVLVVCAVARADPVRSNVEELVDGSVSLESFPDHYDFNRHDIGRLDARAAGRPIVITEKDAVKWDESAQVQGAPVYVLTQRLVWDWGEEEVKEALRAVTGLGSARDPGRKPE